MKWSGAWGGPGDEQASGGWAGGLTVKVVLEQKAEEDGRQRHVE